MGDPMNPMKKIVAILLTLTTAAWLSACARDAAEAPPAEAEVPTLDVTSWTDKTELFMEYPPLVTGQDALFAVHLTRLSDFSAMTTGRPKLELTPESGGAMVTL